MTARDRVPRRVTARSKSKSVPDFLALQKLMKLIRADFEALPDEAAFWQLPEFVRLRTKEHPERLTLDNVLYRLRDVTKPRRMLRRYREIEAGTLTLAAFVKDIISTRII